MDQIAIGRLVVLPFSVLEWGGLLWYALFWDRFPKRSFKRVIPLLIFLVSILAIPIAQIDLYREYAKSGPITDVVFKGILFSENAISISLLLIVAANRRKSARRHKISVGE